MRIDPLKSNHEASSLISGVSGEKDHISSRSVSGKNDKISDASATFSIDESRKLKKVTYGKEGDDDRKKDVNDIMNEASSLDAVAMKNEMVVGAKTISSEDAKKLSDDGFSLRDDDIRTVVTVTDKIKATLAAAGHDVSSMGGVSDAVLDELSKGGGVMAAVTAGMSASDLEADQGLSEEIASNVTETVSAYEDTPLGDDAKAYLISEELPPTIINVGQAMAAGRMTGAPAGEMSGDDLSKAIEKGFERDMIASTPENKEAALWLVEREIPVNYENIEYKKALDSGFVIDPDASHDKNIAVLSDRMIDTASEGEDIKNTTLVTGYSAKEQAEDAFDVISATTDEDLEALVSAGEPLTISNLKKMHELVASGRYSPKDGGVTGDALSLLKAKRMLEETRLVMTIDANRALIKKGMSIDTTELTKLVDELKSVEDGYYKNMYDPNAPIDSEQVQRFKEAITLTEELKYMPAKTIGVVEIDSLTMMRLHEEGEKTAQTIAAAARYETMSTEVRHDLGDSITKAFGNIGDILEDLGYEKNASNERAVRILGYNSMELTVDNIDRIKRADALVQSAFDALKPAVVREFIKEGIDPLSLDIKELKSKADLIKEKLPAFDEQERFSQYLWRIEHEGGITEEERRSYIGIYRLINQVEKNDGAAIGAVVETGRSLSMENLLSAVRTARKGSMDYKIDDDFEGVKGTIKGESITDQVRAAFTGNFSGESENDNANSEASAQEREYYEELIRDMRKAAESPDEVYQAIKTYEVVPSVDNLLVMERMMTEPSVGLKKFFDLTNKDFEDHEDIYEELEDAKAGILEAFSEKLKNPDELKDAMETLANVAEHCGQTFIREDMTSLDLRQLQLSCKQLSVASNMARSHHYNVPVNTDEGVMNVSFKLVKGEESGTITIFTESERYGRLSAKLTVTDDVIKGYIASDSRAGASELSKRIEELPGNIDVLFSHDVKDMAYSMENGTENADVERLFDVAADVVRFIHRQD